MRTAFGFEDVKDLPIPPIPPAVGWEEVPIKECGEKLVPLGPFLEPEAPGFSTRIFQDAIYWGERSSSPYKPGELEGALLTPFVREGMAKRLVQAAASLPEGHALLIWDSYRPLTVQKALYDDYRQQLIDIAKMTPDEVTAATLRYIKMPSSNPQKPSPHNTGAAVDLTIIQFVPEVLKELGELDRKLKSQDWKERYAAEMRRMQLVREHSTPLRMGTAFDEAEPQTGTRFYEEKLLSGAKLGDEAEYLANRRLLFHTMTRAGFTNYFEEWWHFDFGNQFDCIRSGRTAIYGAGVFTPECADWETMRVSQFMGSLRSFEAAAPQTKLGDPPMLEFVRGTARRSGDLRGSRHSLAHRLEVRPGA